MERVGIKNLTRSELEKALAGLGAERYRARQIFRWLYIVGVRSFDEMTDIPEDLRRKLKAKFHITHAALLDSRRSSLDSTTKYLLKLEDGNTVEAVLLPEERRNTICLSSQVGCKYCCGFCASSIFGFVRNLKTSEILDEAIFIKRERPSAQITNLVFMGIGEPFDNYNNVLKAIKIFNDSAAFNIGARRITVSTCGIIPGIERLKNEGLQVELSVSLHSADDSKRSKLVPVNKIYPLKELMKAARDYTDKTSRIITFEYVMLRDVNSSKDDAGKLARLLKGIKCKVNTISYNRISPTATPFKPMKARDYEAPSEADVKIFIRTLKEEGVNVVHRKSKGADIEAGCGQLKASRLKNA